MLRSLEKDYLLYLSENFEGEPKFLEMKEHHCRALAENLTEKLSGKILMVDFRSEEFSRWESVYIPPRDDRYCRTKCDKEGHYVEKEFKFLHTEALIDGYRVFSETKIP